MNKSCEEAFNDFMVDTNYGGTGDKIAFVISRHRLAWNACWGLREKEISLLCDELKEKDHKIAMLKEQHENVSREHCSMQDEVMELISKYELLLECVEFYADLKLYYVQDDGFTKADNDNGDKSRECLKQIKETK